MLARLVSDPSPPDADAARQIEEARIRVEAVKTARTANEPEVRMSLAV